MIWVNLLGVVVGAVILVGAVSITLPTSTVLVSVDSSVLWRDESGFCRIGLTPKRD